MSLIIPPTLQIILFGFALNPIVNNLRMGVVDQSQSVQSRDLWRRLWRTGRLRFGAAILPLRMWSER